jgi:hypothetical protein
MAAKLHKEELARKKDKAILGGITPLLNEVFNGWDIYR